jgi:hypothetical protein
MISIVCLRFICRQTRPFQAILIERISFVNSELSTNNSTDRYAQSKKTGAFSGSEMVFSLYFIIFFISYNSYCATLGDFIVGVKTPVPSLNRYNTRRPHWSLGLISPLRYIVSNLPEKESQMYWTNTTT